MTRSTDHVLKNTLKIHYAYLKCRSVYLNLIRIPVATLKVCNIDIDCKYVNICWVPKLTTWSHLVEMRVFLLDRTGSKLQGVFKFSFHLKILICSNLRIS